MPRRLDCGRRGEIRRGLVAPSPALGREIPYTLYLPDGYADGSARYPVLFLLHGLGGDGVRLGRRWRAWGARCDRLIAAASIPPMIVVAPGMGDSWYVDNPTLAGSVPRRRRSSATSCRSSTGRWRTTARRDGRAVAGLSMGGWGAVRFASLRPDLFVAAASLSGAIITEDWAATPAWAGYFTGAFGTPVDLARFRAASPFTLIPQLAAAEPAPGALTSPAATTTSSTS